MNERDIIPAAQDKSNPAAGETVQTVTGVPTPNDGAENPSQEEPGASLRFLAPPNRAGALGRMDHYDVLEMVGKGGMGLVLRAFDARLERNVAIKVMAPNLAANATARKRFVREAQAGAAVNHKNVVTIHAVAAEHSPPYLVMELVKGRSLDAKIRSEGPPAVKEIVRIGGEIASGLAAAHACGLVHRDIKPANILLEDKTERVKITDFGLAQAANDARLTQSGAVAGTPQYMSPEQALGQRLDARSDLFSLGGVLYFLCTAQAPFRAANTLSVLNQVIKDEPRPIQELNSTVPRWLCDLIARLQAKEPDQRIQTAQEVARTLEQHTAAERVIASEPPVKTRQAGAVTVDWPGAAPRLSTTVAIRRRRFILWPAAVAGVLLLLLAAALALQWSSNLRKKSPGTSDDIAEESSSDPTDGVSRSDSRSGSNSRSSLTVAGKFEAFSTSILAGGDAFRAPPVKRLRQGIPSDCSCIPRGFSPDGKWLCTVSDGDPVVRVWDVATGKQHKELPYPGDITRGPTFSHDGAWLAVFGIDGVLKLWETRNFSPSVILERQPFRIRSAAFNSEDKILATGREDGTVQFWEVATGRKLSELSVSAFPVLGLDFLPGNQRLAVFAPEAWPHQDLKQKEIWYYDCAVKVVDLDEKSAKFQKAVHEWKAPDTQFVVMTVVGEQIYFLKNCHQENPSVAIADTATGRLREVNLPPRIAPVSVVVAAGGLLVACGDKVARFWKADTDKVEWEFGIPTTDGYANFALHPDGRTLAFGADDRTRLDFYSLETRKELRP